MLGIPHRRIGLTLGALFLLSLPAAARAEWPQDLRVVLANTQPLQHGRNGRLPLFVLPITGSLSQLSDSETRKALADLDERGIGYTVEWNHNDFDSSLAEGLRIARFQTAIGQPVAVNANSCLYSFFDGSEATLHVDDSGNRFADTSSGKQLGCPFALGPRVPIIRERIERFLRAYREAAVEIDFIFADWEIDGPIEWNEGWATCKKCERCRAAIPNIDNFRAFQRQLRAIRSEIQRVAFGDAVTSSFPAALVGNYGTYPHGGVRYWYDYFEKEATTQPVVVDQQAKYREWVHEFDGTGYTFAMPVVYTWYPTFGWYNYEHLDYRWMYNMLLVGSNAGQHTPHSTPLIPFVHWTTTAPPDKPDPSVQQFSKAAYQELLWHLLLRGHDTFFLWCLPSELPDEIRLVHEVYAASLEYDGFLRRGEPILFEVPKQPEDVVSGLRVGNQVLVRRTAIGASDKRSLKVALSDGGQVTVPAKAGLYIASVEKPQTRTGLIEQDGRAVFPIGFYELPSQQEQLEAMANAGVNIVLCHNRADLDRAHNVGMMGWVPVSVQQGATDALRKHIESVADHPALAVWEGPDEIIWTFTAYSFLKERAGFTRDDWNDQKKIAVDYAEREAAKIMAGMQEGIELVRQLDERGLPFWQNEAADSDLKYARQYMPFIDITGCDYYAVRKSATDLQSVGRLVDRWDAISRGKPVWMVLQAFSWHKLKPERGHQYPTFDQSRFMAYDAIAHGGKGILYWGSNFIDDAEFRESLYALTSELAELQPFLTGHTIEGAEADVIPDLFDPPGIGVRTVLMRNGEDHLLLLLNEDNHRHLGVDVHGLTGLHGREFKLLYGQESAKVSAGRLTTRMQPFEVKLFCTAKARFETSRQRGRAYTGR